MPFPHSQTTSAPTGAPPPPYQGPPPPPPPPPPPGPASGPDLWVISGGQTVQMTAAQYAGMPPHTSAMSLDQSSGWKTLADFGVAATAAPAQAGWSRGGGGGGGGGGRKSAFNSVGGAQVTRRLPYLSEGDYIFCVHKMFYNEGRTSNAVICEGQVINSNNYGTSQALAEGSAATIYIGKNDAFDRNVKELILALSGFDAAGNPRPDDDYVPPEECEHWVSEANPAQGIMIYVRARVLPLKSDSTKAFTALNYWPVAKLPDGSIDWTKTGP